ncbi:uncharacterized protein MYCFIDRAFT_89955 [Pseudocercospora fijiensis CIRAD86]|uniref:NAD(P)-binding domain-containing protein n=1 Tax=Pseudocercospora fijiensis (strain CIRAD86) TaxID=383855 RepID=N1Q9N7_PSEFD|nr:uncharacterized protein MYCFIDRAFT_89955 [Pseudocercospora fijiensis CIRAD86]EME89610.1 hypothetical protein MYCFIDRAFT_89955 [Pseudocercospora fijiensis CIRAD86]
MASMKKPWAIVGASRGIGAEFVQQLLDSQHNVIATTRKAIAEEAQSRWPSDVRPSIYDLDILGEPSINAFVAKLLQDGVQRIDYLAALNHMLRHMAAELQRKNSTTVVIALHPGEVATDMANIDLGWEVVGQMTPAESVSSCIPVIESKHLDDSGTFWTWGDKVLHRLRPLIAHSEQDDFTALPSLWLTKNRASNLNAMEKLQI